MSDSTLQSEVTWPDQWNGLRAVWLFCLVTAALSIILELLLPGLAGPMAVAFVPMGTAVILITGSAGKQQVRPQLFSRPAWRISLKWAVISSAAAVGLRLGVSLLALALGHRFQTGPFSLPLLIIFMLFAATEEIGWRGFALPRLLQKGWSPLAAALLLGVPWALLHLPLTLPGMLSAGTPMLAQSLVILALSVLTTWVYLAAGRSLTAPTLLHGVQNALASLNYGLSPEVSGWSMVVVYVAAALLVIMLSRGRLGLREAQV
ncbi:MAG: CPBP family intramembrane metalloprotease [Anaerolineaceae bacterium]|nr:CPBP family intramembrane metalloprotease [Anaerolineaceae bacterium]